MSEIASIQDIQIVYQLSKDLDEYGDKMEQALKTLERRHNEMSNSFKGIQFNDLTNVIQTIGDHLKKSISELRSFAAETKEEAKALAAVQDVKLS